MKLTCVVYATRDLPTNVVWYWSQDEATAGQFGVELRASDPEYTIDVAPGPVPILSGDFVGAYYDTYTLTVLNFDSQDDGFYWCQLVVNATTPLAPSPTVYVATNDSITQACNPNDIEYLTFLNECVEDSIDEPCCTTSLYTATTSSFDVEKSSIRTTAVYPISEASILPSPSLPTSYFSQPLPVSSVHDECCSGRDQSDTTVVVRVGIGSAGAVVAVSVCTILAPCLVLCAERRKRETRRKEPGIL